MFPESQEIVRAPLRVRERSSRPLDQRFSLCFPRLGAMNARLIGKRPPTSRLRRAALARAVRLASEAYNASGVSLTEAYAGVATLTDGRPFRLQEYYDHAEALEAVGLAE
jgi:hypothetical protein